MPGTSYLAAVVSVYAELRRVAAAATPGNLPLVERLRGALTNAGAFGKKIGLSRPTNRARFRRHGSALTHFLMVLRSITQVKQGRYSTSQGADQA
jgi:hypothetical protein